MREIVDLSSRRIEPELMDDPDIDAADHRAALRGLARINRMSRSVNVLFSTLRSFADRPLRVLDVASGGGDTLIRISRLAKRANIELECVGCDISTTALEHSRSNAKQAGVEIEWRQSDVLHDKLPCDSHVIICSLFLHHLPDHEAICLVGSMGRAAQRGVIISDLNRCMPGYLAARIGCRLLTRSTVVHTDGPRSVRAAYTANEAEGLAKQAGLFGADVSRCWPWRWLLVWRKESL